MKVTKAAKQKMYLDKISSLERDIASDLIENGYNPDLFSDENAVLSKIATMVEIGDYMPAVRFQAGYQIWLSRPKESNPQHWMHDLCSASSTHMPVPVDEEYDGQHRMLDALTEGGFLAPIQNHSVMAEVNGKFVITCSEASSQSQDTFRNLHMVHPFASTPTFHELLRVILEWHWAYKHAGNRELMAVVCNDFCEYYDLDVDDTTNQVVLDLLSMPDCQVAQYVKTGECSLNLEAPKCPDSVKIWAVNKGFVRENLRSIARLYDNCMKLKSLKEQLSLVSGE